MLVEIWSDVVCPWCYIGKRRFEEALAGFEHRDDVEVVWRSFQLDPTTPARHPGEPTETVAEHLGRKYGGGVEAGRSMIERVQAVAAEVGLDYARYPDAQRANTLDAHRLLHAAGPRQGDLKEALLHAYFVEARNVADHDVLTRVAVGAGLEEAVVGEVLAGDAYRAEVEADVDAAADLGAGGVPFFVVDRRFAISGAQPAEVMAQTLERAWTESVS